MHITLRFYLATCKFMVRPFMPIDKNPYQCHLERDFVQPCFIHHPFDLKFYQTN